MENTIYSDGIQTESVKGSDESVVSKYSATSKQIGWGSREVQIPTIFIAKKEIDGWFQR